MKLKQLESFLGDLQQFRSPKIELEQYPTGPHIASRILYTAENSFGDIENKVVADFGCGCGTLAAAAAVMGAAHTIAIDVDPQSLEIASSNAENLELGMTFVLCDIRNLELRSQMVDTVVMNPPFGTRSKGVDLEFVFKALQIVSGAVYSLHKTSTRDHIKRVASLKLGAGTAEVLCQLRYDVPQLYNFHKKKEVDIAVDLWRFTPKVA